MYGLFSRRKPLEDKSRCRRRGHKRCRLCDSARDLHRHCRCIRPHSDDLWTRVCPPFLSLVKCPLRGRISFPRHHSSHFEKHKTAFEEGGGRDDAIMDDDEPGRTEVREDDEKVSEV